MRNRGQLWVVPLALLALGAASRPAAANVLCDLGVSTKSAGQFGNQLNVGTGQTFFIRVAVLNTSPVPVSSVCEIPGLNVRVGNVLAPFSMRTILVPQKIVGTTLAAASRSAGTFRTTVLVRFLNPYSGRVHEVADTALVVVSNVAGQDEKKDGTGGTGSKKDGTGGLGTGGQQTGGTGSKKDGTGDLGTGVQPTGGLGTGGQQTGGLGTGGQQTGGTGSQTGVTGGQTDVFGGPTGGTGTTGTQQQSGGTGTKKDGTGGTTGKKDGTGGTGGQQPTSGGGTFIF